MSKLHTSYVLGLSSISSIFSNLISPFSSAYFSICNLQRCSNRLLKLLVSRFAIKRIFSKYSSLFEPRHPSASGNTSSGCAFSLIGISPPRGSHRAALLCCDGLRRICRFTLGFRTGRKYHDPSCWSSPSVRMRRTV